MDICGDKVVSKFTRGERFLLFVFNLVVGVVGYFGGNRWMFGSTYCTVVCMNVILVDGENITSFCYDCCHLLLLLLKRKLGGKGSPTGT